MYVNPGKLDKRISIVSINVSDETDDNGFPIKEKKTVRTCFAQLSNTSGTEIQKANSEFSEAKQRFLVRYTNTVINTDMIVRYNSKEYNIVYVNPYGDSKEYMEIWTELSERV